MNSVDLNGVLVGPGHPCFVIAEIGLNHNGDLEIATRLIDAAAAAGCNAVKFQKRTPEECVPADQRDIPRETPWGIMSYLEYRHRVEFGQRDYEAIAAHCAQRGVAWFASCWDRSALAFMVQFAPPALKIPAACLTDDVLLRAYRATGRPLLLSTGMSTLAEIDHAVEVLGKDALIVMHCTSTYPSAVEELNLRCIPMLRQRYDVPIGYSGHEVGLPPSLAAVCLGACVVERHITLSRAMWGSDHAASVEPQGLARLVRDIRTIERALGDGVKRVYDSELPIRKKLRRVGG